jgi:hypothetical protein
MVLSFVQNLNHHLHQAVLVICNGAETCGNTKVAIKTAIKTTIDHPMTTAIKFQ